MDKLNVYINKDVDTQPSQYIAFRQKEIAGLFEKSVFKAVNSDKVPSNT